MGLFTWTGWTKEDWLTIVSCFVGGGIGAVIMWLFMFAIGYFS